MFKNLLLALSFIAMASAPAGAGQIKQAASVISGSDEGALFADFDQMANGDYSYQGKGSVTDELSQYSIDSNTYSSDHTKVLMMGECDTKVYLYLYSADKRIDFDRVSLSLDTYATGMKATTVDASKFLGYKLSIRSYSSDEYFQKYLVENLTFDPLVNHVYTVREIYSNSTKANSLATVTVSTAWAFDATSGKSVVSVDDYFTITDKMVAYELIPQNISTALTPHFDHFIQSNYCCFKMADRSKIAKVTRIDCEYQAQWFCGEMGLTVPLVKTLFSADQLGDFYNKDLLQNVKEQDVNEQGLCSVSLVYPCGTSIYSEKSNYTYKEPWDWFGICTKTYSLDKIVDLATVDATKWEDPTIAKKYDFMVRFLDQRVNIGSASVLNGNNETSVMWRYGHWFIGYPQSFDIEGFDSNFYRVQHDTTDMVAYAALCNGPYFDCSPVNVTDFTVLKMWYFDQSGTPRDAIVIDNYSDTIGGKQITKASEDNSWVDRLLKILTIIVVVIVGLVLLSLIASLWIPIKTVFAFVGKAIKWIIIAPFKFMKWIFSSHGSKRRR
jgi:hypothetical protein